MSLEQKITALATAVGSDVRDLYTKIDRFIEIKQQIPLAVWVLQHNLGKFPSVTTVDSSGEEVIAGANLPPTPWKTLSKSGGLYNPVSVTMTSTLAQQIFFATMLHDAAIHQAAETHRAQMLLLDDPYEYNYHINWPESFED